MTMVAAQDWLTTVQQARDDGYAFFDWLGCVDEIGHSDTFRVVLVLRDLDHLAAGPRTLTTEVPRDAPRLDSIGSVFAGAGWHEREAAELFGIEFVGGSTRRLLLDPAFTGTPLRKDEVLAARAGITWPGAKDPGEGDDAGSAGPSQSPSRRRMAPPGVPDPAVWGDRNPAEASADPAEVAASAVGGRVRRRRR